MNPCVAPPKKCPVHVSQGSFDCGSCEISGSGSSRKVKAPCDCTYSCNAGYTLSTPSDPTRYCDSSGNWDETRPSCNSGSGSGNFSFNTPHDIGLGLSK